MRHLFLAKEGAHRSVDGRLNEKGRQQTRILSKAIKSILNDSLAYIVSLTTHEARGSAEILAVRLGLPRQVEKFPYLWPGSDSHSDDSCKGPNWDSLMKLIEERQDAAEGLILVDHYKLFDYGFASYYIRKKFEDKFNPGIIRQGEAVHIDSERGAYQVLFS